MSEGRFAVVRVAGKQYRVTEGSRVTLNQEEGEVGAPYTFPEVLAVGSADAISLGIGTVSGKVLSHHRGPKLITFKKTRRKGYQKKIGHRQDQTTIIVDQIQG